jgi:PKD repeat protein
MNLLTKKLKRFMSFAALVAIISLLVAPALVSPIANALTVDTSEYEDAACDWLEDSTSVDVDGDGESTSVLGCDDDSETTSFTDFQGDYSAPDADGYADGITETGSVREFIVNVTNFVLSFLGLAAVTVIIYGGFLYVTAGGEQERADKGKKSVTYAVIGILLVLISYALVNTIIQGAASGEDVTSDGSSSGLYSSSGVSGESLTSFSNEDILESIQDISASYVEAYTTFVNTSAILEAMANVVVFDSNGLDEYEEGFELIDDQVSSFSETGDYVSDALKLIRRYISQHFSNEVKSLVTSKDWMKASVLLVDAEDDAAAVLDALLEACYDDCGDSYDILSSAFVVCYADCAGDTYTEEAVDPFEIASELITYLENTSLTSIYDLQTTTNETIDALEDIQALYNETGDVYSAIGNAIDGLAEYDGNSSSSTDSATAEAASEGDAYDEANTSGYGSDQYDFTNLSSTVSERSIDIYNEAPGGNSLVGDVVAELTEAYGLTQDMEFVTAVISANTKEGNAPVTVTFDALDSYDPSNTTIGETQYKWDLLGNGFENSDTESDDTTSSTDYGSSISMTYDDPGTYVVALQVDSSDSNIGSGLSYLSVKVNPPSANIVLTAEAGGATHELTNATEPISFTGDQVIEGVTFDASGTTGQDSTDTIVNYNFDFGDGENQSGESPTAIYYYDKEETYYFELEVTNENGVSDRKLVTIIIKSPAAFIETPDGTEANIGETLRFDGSGSVSDNGGISGYDWLIEKDGEEVATFTGEVGGTRVYEEIEYTFEYPGEYLVTLDVNDKSDKEDQVSVIVLIHSTPPIAAYTYEIPSDLHPNVVYFDGTQSSDPDEGDTLTYEWTIEGDEGTDYDFTESTDNTSAEPVVAFYEEGDYQVTLTVYDQYEEDLQESDSLTDDVTIDSTLSIEYEATNNGVSQLETAEDGTAKAEANITLTSNEGVSYEIDWADGGTVETVAISSVGEATKVSHAYYAAGTYAIKATVSDPDGGSNEIIRNIYIGDNDSPIAIIKVTVDELESADSNEITGNRNTSFYFDGTGSLNKQGEAKAFNSDEYTWDFGDGTTSAEGESHKHPFDEVGSFDVTLTVTSEEKTSSATVTIVIEDLEPQIYGITVTPQGTDIITPLQVRVDVNAEDLDAEDDSTNANNGISSYKYWYYDLNDTAEKLGTQIASTSYTYLTINTKGTTGEAVEYGFGVEVTDSENNTTSSVDALSDDEIPTLEVENGANKAPYAEFSADRTSILVGESVTFTSTSYDEDGDIEDYIWDLEGDGFYNNDSTDEATLTYTFDTYMPDGIDVYLKVIDESNSTGISDPVRIYVDSLTDDPEAAFTYSVSGFEVQFANNSSADTDNGAEVVGFEWDFNTDIDSDGNGIKDDDVDSTDENPLNTYDAQGNYEVKLTIMDNEGNSDDVDQTISMEELEDPEAAFTYELDGLSVTFDSSNSDTNVEGVLIESFEWDFDTDVDSDGNGVDDDDVDSIEENPTYIYEDVNFHNVTLKIVDELSRSDEVSKKVELDELEEPEAAFTYETNGLTVTFDSSNSSSNIDEIAIAEYVWDFDTSVDSDGNEDNDDDEDSTAESPTNVYEAFDHYKVKLTIIDELGREDSSTQTLEFTDAPELIAFLTSSPSAEQDDGKIHIEGTNGDVTFSYSSEGGNGEITYCLDKNVYYDSDGDGTTDNDCNEETTSTGNYSTDFDESWGLIVVKLTVSDEIGQEDSVVLEVTFDTNDATDYSASLMPVTTAEALYILATAFAFTILGAKLYTRKEEASNN